MFTRYGLPVIALVGLIFAVVFVHAGNKAVPATLPVADPAQAPYASYIAGAGIVEASTENINLGTPVAGVVTKLDHWIGDRVKAGDILFRIDSRDQEAELKVRQAALVSAKANVTAQEAVTQDAENQWKKAQEMSDSRAMSREETDRRQFAALAAEGKLQQARADVLSAQASIDATTIELDRRIVRAPVDGTVMQCKIHLGEYAPAGPVDPPLMMIGNTDLLNVRVDIDENDAWRLEQNRSATAFIRGNRDIQTPLQFVRVEPYVVPKKSLTGDSTERVDTRVLQVLYSFDPKKLRNVYVGQQMDVFIEAGALGTK
jgi:RND family efflux transporter MFP subunit